MAHGHDHSPDVAVEPEISRALWATVAVLGLAVVAGLLILWPSGPDGFDDPLLLEADPVEARVIGDELGPCSYDETSECRLIRFEIEGVSPFERLGAIEVALDSPIDSGDDILLSSFETESGELVYSFYDFERESDMVLLAALFALVVVALGRWRGVGALAGLALSFLIIVAFAVPAILDGQNAVTVAVVAAAAIAFVALFLAHGTGPSTAVALVSTLASLLLTALLAWAFVGATDLTGLTDDSSLLLAGLRDGIDARGILLAGIVIGALGVLDDVTVTQVSAVWELKAAQPNWTARELVRPAMRIGRDHISSTVNTLFLAYAGAALPLLLLFSEADQGFRSVVTRELVAIEVVRTLVGSIGLVASVPIATWLAATVVAPPQSFTHDGVDTDAAVDSASSGISARRHGDDRRPDHRADS